jgi:23S rRNA (cytosine1962-C5)-methyltransferase
LKVWNLKKGVEKKFHLGHPWVFSNDLAHSPKGLPPGSPVELRDANGDFLAIGYGHPNSLISFRLLSRRQKDELSIDFFVGKLQSAFNLRRLSGLENFSYRFSFAENDGLPGLIIDRYRLTRAPAGPMALADLGRDPLQLFVIQSSTAGMDQLMPTILDALEAWVETGASGASWEQTGIVLSNDSKSRLLENIPVEEKRIHKALFDMDLTQASTVMQPSFSLSHAPVFTVDFLGGQKTGFFLDQRVNAQLVAKLLHHRLQGFEKGELKILDLCSYIGQWGTQLAHTAQSFGVKVSVTSVDASQKALELARRNVEAHGASCQILKQDVLRDLGREGLIANEGFDVVICDPPAFIKKKKDIPTGQSAYLKMNREAIRKVAPGGIFISCSCSGLFEDEEFRKMLARASAPLVSSETGFSWLERGTHSPDHPQRPEFPQGTYLKSWIGVRPRIL